ncbi:MAG TPA: phage tail sheath C-terminal domain-containing protein, partial [Pyrinomonadaceae bacterium]|nr:phage tail sheath C-terminal domain-containing protein [Pyrinomonadaceae bacterium]
LVLQKKRGIRVVKGITTDDEAFKQITLRRIVDYVKQGTRLGANQYIGKLNNKRVRDNLRTTLDSFLADLLIREFLTGYKLTVFADRPMEIRGEVLVTMDLNPTFSIDVIRVVMNLS